MVGNPEDRFSHNEAHIFGKVSDARETANCSFTGIILIQSGHHSHISENIFCFAVGIAHAMSPRRALGQICNN